MRLSHISLSNLKRRKGKTLFLALGLLIGIATVVTLLSITQAMKEDINKKLDEFGANIVIVPKSDNLSLSYGGVTISSVSSEVKELSEEDAAKIRTIKNKENINIVAPKLLGAVDAEGKRALLVGVLFPDELKLKKWWEWKGKKPSNSNDLILGSEAAKKLRKKISEKLRINGEEFRVVAVLKETGSQEDGLIFADLKETQKLLGKPGSISLIEVAAWCYSCPIEEIVRQTSQVLPQAKVSAVKQVVQSKMYTLEMFSQFSIVLSLVVLFIGSLIVLTTMMSSVNERTREIGIFRAIGYRKSHIMKIILLEALVVSLASGLLGYLLGTSTAKLLAPKVAGLSVAIGWNPLLVIGAVGLAILIGLLGSLYPAWRASHLDPAQALRFI